MKKAEGRRQKAEAALPSQAAAHAAQSQFANRKSEIPSWLLAGLLVLVTLALYWPATRCDFSVVDDLILTPEVVKGLSLESIRWAFLNPVDELWQPLTVLSHMLDCQVFGLKPWGHHLTSVLLHALNAALVFALLYQMTGGRWRSLWVAALFAVHPLRVEPVAWVDERRELLGACFGLLALMAYVRYARGSREKAESRKQKAESGNQQSEAQGRWSFSHLPSSSFYLLSLGFFACGLMSKPTIVTWPFVMLLLDYWPLRRLDVSTLHALRSTLLRLIREKIPFFVLVGLSIVVTTLVQQLGGSLASGRANPLGARLGNAVYSYGWYLGKLFWPADLAVFYPHPGYWPLGKVVLAGGLILGVSVLVGLGWRRRPYLLVGWLWYCGVLVPNSQVVQTFKVARADRWTYLPLLGFLILVVWGACELMRGKAAGGVEREEREERQERGSVGHALARSTLHAPRSTLILLSVAGGVALVLCLALTRHQLGYWKDSETLLRHSLAVTGDNSFSLLMLGAALDKKGQSDEAIRLYQESIRLEPDYFVVHYLLGVAFGRRGQIDEAIRQYQESIHLVPGYAPARYYLANALIEKGEIDEAIRQYQESIRLLPGYIAPYNNLGLAFSRKGQTDEAIRQYQEALRREPDDPDVHYNLGAALARLGQMDEAIRHYQEALRLKPDRAEAHNNLGAALLQQGRAGEAIREFQEALRLKPGYADARKNLIVALAQASPSPPPGTATNR